MKFYILLTAIFIVGMLTGGITQQYWLLKSSPAMLSPLSPEPTVIPKPLLKYSFDNLNQSNFTPKTIDLSQEINSGEKHSGWLFDFETREGRVSGTANISAGCALSSFKSKCPVIIMLRGYVDKEAYMPGIGTKKAAEVFADNGFLTLAPDFLGFGSSDPEPQNEIESRLIKPATVLQLLASISNLPMADTENIFLWGHSNGGQIGLSVLTVSNRIKAASFWAPVSKPFPYSILYYTGDSDDHGKYLRKSISEFESVYDPELFSVTNYLDRIETPLIVHQGTGDEAVPWEWSMDLIKTLQSLNKQAVLYQYPGADHNLTPGWNSVVKTDLKFFNKFISPSRP
ncbi:prolyl oligopeptidase family serine peptidase [Candidatus Collierbacteria bacterium]|nr:prolyl oligopeptidase family serine peptidase [Candidatus Collierbacteria bacterium]